VDVAKRGRNVKMKRIGCLLNGSLIRDRIFWTGKGQNVGDSRKRGRVLDVQATGVPGQAKRAQMQRNPDASESGQPWKRDRRREAFARRAGGRNNKGWAPSLYVRNKPVLKPNNRVSSPHKLAKPG
jgi:hypothetical protein